MRRIAATLSLIAALALPAAAQAAPGDLDETFSQDGLVTAAGEASFVGVAVAPGGAVLASTDSTVHRFTPDGSEDPGFGGRGIVAVAGIADLDLRGDGRIVVGATQAGDFHLVELQPNGAPGCAAPSPCPAVVDFDGRDDRLYDVFADPSGATLAAGVSSAPAPAGNRLAVTRLLPSGAPDPSFDDDGELLFDSGGVSTFAESAAVAGLPDGSVLLAGAGPGPDGSGAGDALLAKFEPDGDLDPTFGGGDGFLTIDLAVRDDVDSIDVGADGSILLGIQPCAFGLHTSCRAAVAKVTSSGELDAGFGSGGIVDDAAGSAVAAAGGGGVFAAGGTPLHPYFASDFALASYTATGSLQTDFGGEGQIATADFGLSQDTGFAVAPSTPGGVVVAGAAGSSPGLARFELADGPPDMDADGRLDDADRCPRRYAPHKTGCPKLARKVKLNRRGPRLIAKVRSGIGDICNAKQRLRVVRVQKGPDRRVAKPRTSASGNWRSAKLARGSYRAKIKQKIGGEIGRCSAAKSKRVRIG